jgi:flagellar motor component MotA
MVILSSIAILLFFQGISLPHIPGTFALFIISASFVFALHQRTPFPYKMALKIMTRLFRQEKRQEPLKTPAF